VPVGGERVVDVAEGADVVVGKAIGGDLHRESLHGNPKGIEVADLCRGKAEHRRALVACVGDEPVGGEEAQRLAHWRRADSVCLGDLVLAKLEARGEPSGGDIPAEALDHILRLAQRTLGR
jgi:hypothetical protein